MVEWKVCGCYHDIRFAHDFRVAMANLMLLSDAVNIRCRPFSREASASECYSDQPCTVFSMQWQWCMYDFPLCVSLISEISQFE